MRGSSHLQRAITAVVFLVLLITGCLLVDVFLSAKNQPLQEVSGNVAEGVIAKGETLSAVLEEYPDQVLSAFGNDLSEAFKEECFDPSGYEDVYVHENESVISFFLKTTGDESYDVLRKELEEKGWSCVDSGVRNKASFVKAFGSIRWLLLEVYATKLGSMVLITKGGNSNA